MHQLVIGGSQERVSSESAEPGAIDQRLRMFNPDADRERLWLHEHASLMQHLECVACAMPDRQRDMICGDDFTAFQFHRADLARAILGCGDVDTGDFRPEPVFAAKRLDPGPDALDDSDQAERAYMRLAIP